MKKEFGEYYLGLDIGTDSVGWAVTDTEYALQKFNGKAMWGIRLFEEATPAAERRLHRSARRREQRRKNRIDLLQELFSEEICKVDPGFYLRLKESKFYQEDKSENQANTLFNDHLYSDKEYHTEFPTIHHLRKALIENKKDYDIRLVYLALHNILKNRGHFLFEGRNISDVLSFEPVYRELKQYLYDEFGIDFNCTTPKEMENIIKNKKMGIQKKAAALSELISPNTIQEKTIIKAIAGGKVKLSDLFDMPELTTEEKNSIQFSSAQFDDDLPVLENFLQDKLYLVEKLKAIYDWGILAEIRGEEPYLSYAKVNTYEKHKLDLKILKLYARKYIPELYNDIFSSNEKCNYCAYVGISKKNSKKLRTEKTCSQEELCKYLEKKFEKDKEEIRKDVDGLYLLTEIINRTLLPKQTSKDNATIPYQLHLEELKVILKNASTYLLFLNDTDDSGLSVSKKVEEIMKFRIPYYVGPLNDAHLCKGGFAWIVKREKGKIFPWNFEKNVDIEASAENFITRMTNKCTYVIGADVLPKNSLIYSKFMVLNEINNLKIDGEEIPVSLKQSIYTDLFMKQRKVTGKKLFEYLKCNNYDIKIDAIGGIDGDCKSSLASYIDMKDILGDKVNNTNLAEDIILSISLFGDDKKLLKKKLMKKYPKELTEEEIDKLCTKKYLGWGRLSNAFLQNIFAPSHETGEYVCILQAMWETNNNLMQLLSREYEYENELNKINEPHTKSVRTMDYSIVDELHVSPSVKRMLWQSLTIVNELRKVMGKEPKRIFIEMARGKENTGRTTSRKAQLMSLYEQCKEETILFTTLQQKSENDIRSDRLYLYYTQLGRCMYSGEKIELDDLFDKNIYDVDHIFPQSKTKDDSLNNRVLVKKVFNANKSDEYPLPKEWQQAQKKFWAMLMSKGFISKIKYERLVRRDPLSERELADFIQRQLVETRQTTKAAADILKRVCSTSEVVYVKAGNVSDFRQKYNLIKVREINDFHHAKDAFLNIVVGNVYYTKFTSNPYQYIKNAEYRAYNLRKIFDSNVERGGLIAWNADKDETLKRVLEIMGKNNILFTRNAREIKGTLFDQMLMPKEKGQVQIKEDARLTTAKYGGYNKAAGAYFILVEHIKKGKITRTIESVPVYLAKRIESSPGGLEKFVDDVLGLKEAKIILRKIKINTLFQIDGFRMHLSGRTGTRLVFKNANQLVLSEETVRYCKKIVNYMNRCKDMRKKGGEVLLTGFDGIAVFDNLSLYNLFVNKLGNTIYRTQLSAQATTLKEQRQNFIELPIELQCVLLYELLHFFQCNSVLASLELILGPQNAGRVGMSNEVTNKHNIKILAQSPTGLFEKEVNLGEL